MEKKNGDNSICFLLLYGVRRLKENGVERSKVERRKEMILVSVVKRGLRFWLSHAAIESKNIRSSEIKKKTN